MSAMADVTQIGSLCITYNEVTNVKLCCQILTRVTKPETRDKNTVYSTQKQESNNNDLEVLKYRNSSVD